MHHAPQTRSPLVLGAGSWGTTLALHLARRGEAVTLWEFDPRRAAEVAQTRYSLPFLPEHPLPEAVAVTSDLERALAACGPVVIAVPSHVLPELAPRLRPYAPQPERLWISATKGIDEATGLTPGPLLGAQAGLAPQRFVVLAGPSFAADVAAGRPTAVLAASDSSEAATAVQTMFSDDTFRVYTNSDPLGVEVGVALKNVIAIAAGLADGLELGANARGALITRGLAEIMRLGVRLGAEAETFLGLAGIGDLVLTCTSPLSRNYRVGFALAAGRELKQVLNELQMVAEGVRTCRSVMRLSALHQVPMPISREIHAVLYEAKDPRAAVLALMRRPLTTEFWGVER